MQEEISVELYIFDKQKPEEHLRKEETSKDSELKLNEAEDTQKRSEVEEKWVATQ